jgi:hypothetical protein
MTGDKPTQRLPEPIEMRRLSFIKYLYRLAVAQSRKSEPLSSASLLTFHDSVELFLQLASERLDVGKERIDFVRYWEEINPKLTPDELTQNQSMIRLNKARVALKHHGTLPSKLDIEAFRASATSFFEENTSRVFGVDFSRISMLELVENAPVREALTKAETHVQNSKFDDALGEVSLAFALLMDDPEGRLGCEAAGRHMLFESLQGPPSSHAAGLDLSADGFSGRGLAAHAAGVDDYLGELKNAVETLQETTWIIGLGVDFRRYLRFLSLRFQVLRMASGKYEVCQETRYRGTPLSVCRADVDFCLDFVVETALTLQESEPGNHGDAVELPASE